MRERVCQYGDCQSTDVEVTMNLVAAMERPTFCCLRHAGLYLLNRDIQTSLSGRNATFKAIVVELSQRADIDEGRAL